MLKPYEPAGGDRVAPLREGESAFTLSDSEKELFDLFAKEQVDIIGTPLDYFSQQLEQSSRDPLYDEPTQRSWAGPFKMKAWVSWASSIPVTSEEGFRFQFLAQVWVPRAEVERVGMPAPFEGDVLRFWNIPFFNDITDEGVAGSGYFFDVINADNDGHINDTSTFVGFRLDVKRRTEFTPERRISPP